jgi:deoxyribodipyrimidine photo-lyase
MKPLGRVADAGPHPFFSRGEGVENHSAQPQCFSPEQPTAEKPSPPGRGWGEAALQCDLDANAPEPTRAAALERLAAVRPAAYARTRNHLCGAVTRLSPYLTHGLLGLAETVAALRARHALPLEHKLVQELGWRAFFQHSARHLRGAILQSLRAGVLPDAAYARNLPDDFRQACTGVPAVDQAVRTLYTTGYLHNHARMWLASYAVHVRKVHWRVGADWMIAHLLDGDLASNHLSWQWIAGTASSKPYLFNADNVARYAPSDWHSAGTAIDTDYATLDALARSPCALAPEPRRPEPTPEPSRFAAPPDGGFAAPDAAAVAGQAVWLVHPWALDDPPPELVPVAVLDADWHARWPWSAQRWAFVTARMRALAALRWIAPAPQLIAALRSARAVHGWRNPHLAAGWQTLPLVEPAAPWPEPPSACRSFSAYWSWVRVHVSRTADPSL